MKQFPKLRNPRPRVGGDPKIMKPAIRKKGFNPRPRVGGRRRGCRRRGCSA